MDKFIEFLKNNTAAVAVAAGIVLFIAMNGITSCVAGVNGNHNSVNQESQQEQPDSPQNGTSGKKAVSLPEEQLSATKNYDDATEKIVETLEGCKWAAIDGTGSLTIKDGVITEKYGETDSESSKVKTKKQAFAITAIDSVTADQTGALSWNVLSVIDSEGRSHIMTLSTASPIATGEGGDMYHDVSCDLFHNEGGYTNNRSCEDVSIPALKDENFKKAIGGHTKELRKSLVEFLLANHSTTTELVWDGTVTEVFADNVKTFTFSVRNSTTLDDDSSSLRINVTYHLDTHEFSEVDLR